jgi:hypothetical protein
MREPRLSDAELHDLHVELLRGDHPLRERLLSVVEELQQLRTSDHHPTIFNPEVV